MRRSTGIRSRPVRHAEGHIDVITARIVGGLGNQMFQYAAALALARHHGTDVRLDIGEFRVNTARRFQLRMLQVGAAVADDAASEVERLETVPRALVATGEMVRRIGRRIAPRTDEIYHEPTFHFDPGFFDLKPPVTLSGYFQSERYFTSVADEVRQQFKLLRPLPAGALAVAERVERTPVAVSVHVRRGDYVNQPDAARVHGVHGADYYRRATNIIEAGLGSNVTFFVFSDEPETASSILDFLPRERLVLVKGDPDRPWDDLTVMSRCHHHVVANSSFSWWGAWLNPRPDKRVVAPRAWFTTSELRQKNTCDLYPDHWILV